MIGYTAKNRIALFFNTRVSMCENTHTFSDVLKKSSYTIYMYVDQITVE